MRFTIRRSTISRLIGKARPYTREGEEGIDKPEKGGLQGKRSMDFNIDVGGGKSTDLHMKGKCYHEKVEKKPS